MDLMKVFHQACGEFPQFRSQIVHARDVTPDPGVRAQLDQLLASMDKSFAEFKQTFPRAADDVNQTLASAKGKAEEASRMLAAAEQQRAEFDASLKAGQASTAAMGDAGAGAAEAAALATRSPHDLVFAAQLRQELLNRFTNWRQAGDAQKGPDHEIWEDWEDSWSR